MKFYFSEILHDLKNMFRILRVRYNENYGYKHRYYWFLFKWFLIGKYHCEVPKKYKRYYWFLHKALWLLIIESVALNVINILY